MLVLHANWTEGHLHIWGESLSAWRAHRRRERVAAAAVAGESASEEHQPIHHEHHAGISTIGRHNFAAEIDEVRSALNQLGIDAVTSADPIRLHLPSDPTGPMPSERLSGFAEVLEDIEEPHFEPAIGAFDVPSCKLDVAATIPALLQLEQRISVEMTRQVQLGQSLRYWMHIARFVLDLIIDQRVIPTVVQPRGNGLVGGWQPWLHDKPIARRLAGLLSAMPPVVRAVDDDNDGQSWMILESMLSTVTDAIVRNALIEEAFDEALEDRDATKDEQVAWLSGLLGEAREIPSAAVDPTHLLQHVRSWIRRLDDTGADQVLHLLLEVHEPLVIPTDDEPAIAFEDEPLEWRVSFHLSGRDDPDLRISAEAIWNRATGIGVNGQRIEHPQEILLAELGRASRMYPKIETALEDHEPTGLELNTRDAFTFLREIKPILEESGIEVIAPEWWNQPAGRIGARLLIESEPIADGEDNENAWLRDGGRSVVGLDALVQYRWQLAVGDEPLTMEEFEELARSKVPLVRVHGQWVEVRPEDMQAARAFLREHPGGEVSVLEAMRLAHGAAERQSIGLDVLGFDATGWVADVFGASDRDTGMVQLDQPKAFRGDLRAYQKTGLSWLAFLDRYGFGACLADDMGLGKTIQLIALLQHERTGAQIGVMRPTLLVVPTSVVSNWTRELDRFSPELRWHVHHGPDRPQGDAFVEAAESVDVVITTYALISRDRETIERVSWHRVVLDEAQYIKNPPTKQTMAIRALDTDRRIALTGTPLENRLTELWSIMEFLNPGYLGSRNEFKKRFAVPIERHRDQRRADQLRGLVQPFILRRLKTDPDVISDLPDCVITKEFATLTQEQATLYQKVVNSMLEEVDDSGGIKRRGLVLAALVKLKQICDHPALYLKEAATTANGVDDATPLAARSGKCVRMMQMLDEILAVNDRALVFTQFRQMGHLLSSMIQSTYDCEVLYLHGGTPAAKRQQLIDRFQDESSPARVFVLSLKAGGLGLNLTAANHVFHFDRWWNPAVENQATDRAYRIGQTRNVHVHKFVCQGTLEERIDEMIEQKMELATNIIGSGEQWLTELSTNQLRGMLTLREDALEDAS